MEDCLTRELACFSGIQETIQSLIALLKTSDGADDSAFDAISDKLSRSGRKADDLAAEYTILKKEWDGIKDELDPVDRGRMGELGERIRALSFLLVSLYNEAAELAAASAHADRKALGVLQRGATTLGKYRTDDGDRSLFDTKA
jgi:hypothetical protein